MLSINRFNFNFTLTNVFIVLSFFGFLFYEIGILNSLNFRDDYFFLFIKSFLYTFIHGGLFHFLFNSFFLFYFGNIIELSLNKIKYFIFFLFTALFSGFLLNIFNPYTDVIGISGFCMALLSYYTLDLKDKNNPEYKTGIVFLIINIAYGLYPGISFLGHLLGAVCGVIFYYLNKEFLRKKMVGAFN